MRIPHRLPVPHTGSEDTPADKISLIAQKYAGYFVGHNYRFDQQSIYEIVGPDGRGIHVDTKKPWKEPNVVRDNCQFCERTTDEEVERRVLGFQHQIDIEILRGARGNTYRHWLLIDNPPGIVDWVTIGGEDNTVPRKVGVYDSAANRRAFCLLLENHSTKDEPTGWEHKPLNMTLLPLRLKRKMVIEWNHVYRDYIAENPDVVYDFEVKNFFKNMPDLPPLECCGGTQIYVFEVPRPLHTEHCDVPVETETEDDSYFSPWLGV